MQLPGPCIQLPGIRSADGAPFPVLKAKLSKLLVVRQTWSAHQEINALLSELRKTRKSAPTKEDIEKLPPAPPPRKKFQNTSRCSAPAPKLPPLMPDEKRDAIVQGNNHFAFDLYAKLRDQSPGNLFFSPYGISTALAMAYAGSRGETAAEMAKTLHFALAQEELPRGFQALINALPTGDFPGCRLLMADRLWCQKKLTFREEFLTMLRDRFQSELGIVDFQQPEVTRNMINDWVKEKTNQKIKELFDPGSISPQIRLIMTSAIYFKGNWAQPFDESATRQKPFYAMNKEIVAQMMFRRGVFHYAQNNEMQILEEPYLGGCLSMVILLPKEPGALAELEKSLTVEKLKEWFGFLTEQVVDVYLPCFKIDATYDMIPSLRLMGMKNAFDSNAADFSGINSKTEPLWLGGVTHHACIQVDEEGTEAAAATGIMGSFGAPPHTYVFRANHPFVFLISDRRTGCILFLWASDGTVIRLA